LRREKTRMIAMISVWFGPTV